MVVNPIFCKSSHRQEPIWIGKKFFAVNNLGPPDHFCITKYKHHLDKSSKKMLTSQ